MKPFKSFTRISLIMMLAFAVQLSSCKKDDDDSGSNPLPPTGSTYKTAVTGKVTDTNGDVVIGVTVKLGTKTAISDDRGYFLFVNADIPKDRFVVTANKSGYFDCIKAKKSQSGEANYLNLVMQALPNAVNISGTAGGVLNLTGGARITFPANAFVNANGTAYTGTVKVYARHFNPAAAGFEEIVPGGDLIGVTTTGQTKSLYSLGMIEALLKDNTGLNEIKLATGVTAQLRFPIDATQAAQAQTTIPMWHLNTTSSKWEEDGQAVKSGNYFEGSVSHFSTWNCDYQGERTDISGIVVDCQNNPMAGIVVTINNFMTVITDNTGGFTTWVPVGYSISCQALQVNNPVLTNDSPIQTITAVGGTVNIIPPIIIPCATRIAGSVKVCGTNTLVPGFVYISWNGGSIVQYAGDGTYNMHVPENIPVIIRVNSNGFTGSRNFTTGAASTTATVPDIQLCDAIEATETKFTINTGGNTTNFVMSNMSTSTNFVDGNSDGIFETASINIEGIANPGNYHCNIIMNLNQRINDYYPLGINAQNNVLIEMDSIWYYGSGLPGTVTNNRLIFTDYGSPGGVATGVFNYDTGTGTVTGGVFSVLRDN